MAGPYIYGNEFLASIKSVGFFDDDNNSYLYEKHFDHGVK